MIPNETARRLTESCHRSSANIMRQRAVVGRLRARGRSVVDAEALLEEFEVSYRLKADRLQRLTASAEISVFAEPCFVEVDPPELSAGCDQIAERQRFVDWTFEKELDQIESLLGSFDRHLPTADIAEARTLIALLSVINNKPSMAASFPTFRGYDMHWWVNCISLVVDGERRLQELGIFAAVEAWREAEHDWNRYRGMRSNGF